jgi:hypothetical protein
VRDGFGSDQSDKLTSYLDHSVSLFQVFSYVCYSIQDIGTC